MCWCLYNTKQNHVIWINLYIMIKKMIAFWNYWYHMEKSWNQQPKTTKTWHWSLKFFIASRQTTEIWTISCETLVASSWRNKIVILGNPPGNASKMPFFVPVLGTFIIYISRYFTIQTQNLNTLWSNNNRIVNKKMF